MEAQLLEMPRSASRTPSSPSVPRPWGPVEAGGEEGGHDVFSPSWRILRSRLAELLFGQGPLCLSVLPTLPVCSLPSDQRKLLPTPLLSEAGPLDFASAFLSAASAPGCSGLQVGTFTGSSSLEAGLFPEGAPPGVGGQGRSRQGGGRGQLTWAAERRPLQSLWTVWEAPFPSVCLVNRHFKNYVCAGASLLPMGFLWFC